MEQNEKQLIDGLFTRLQQAETQSPPRDQAAEAQIRAALKQQPAAPYYMAQAILMQEHMLEQLNQRVEQLEQELSQRPASASFLGGLFGGSSQPPSAAANPAQRAPLSPPANAGRGGFMGSAMQTAMAVAGGVMVGNMLANMFTGGASEAAEPNVDDGGAGFEDTGSYGQDDFGMDSDLGGFDDFGDF